mmetsp:Transcript_6190/g.13432  ORF Transcript_6190/g.13432 Transcript_6190/m.13432 type:complete len:99 (+) Transcript_6190:641-937(+)
MSMRPYRDHAEFITLLMLYSFPTSAASNPYWKVGWVAIVARDDATLDAASELMSTTWTARAPDVASSTQSAAPIPDPPPVTTAILFFTFPMMSQKVHS